MFCLNIQHFFVAVIVFVVVIVIIVDIFIVPIMINQFLWLLLFKAHILRFTTSFAFTIFNNTLNINFFNFIFMNSLMIDDLKI